MEDKLQLSARAEPVMVVAEEEVVVIAEVLPASPSWQLHTVEDWDGWLSTLEGSIGNARA